jgi:membrane associated rhomboid family serine protease
MTPTSVGMRCPECSRQRTKVKTAASIARGSEPVATYAIIAVNVLAYLGSGQSLGGFGGGGGGGGSAFRQGALYGPAVADQHEYWRLVTSGFLHSGFFHIALNMYFIYVLGRLLEPALGRARFVAVYFASLLMGSFGALLLTPGALTVGASGAAFGLMGCAIVVARSRGIDLWSSGLGPTLLLNLALGLTLRGISIGGHLGGLVGGLIAGWLVVEFGERRGQRLLPLAGCAVVGAVGVAGAIAVSGMSGLAPSGVGFF